MSDNRVTRRFGVLLDCAGFSAPKYNIVSPVDLSVWYAELELWVASKTGPRPSCLKTDPAVSPGLKQNFT